MEVNRTLRLTNINVVLSDDNGDSSGSITPVEEDPGLPTQPHHPHHKQVSNYIQKIDNLTCFTRLKLGDTNLEVTSDSNI